MPDSSPVTSPPAVIVCSATASGMRSVSEIRRNATSMQVSVGDS
jgi:hypothetical protein